MRHYINKKITNSLEVVQTQYTDPVDISMIDGFELQLNVDVDAHANKTFKTNNDIESVSTIDFDTKANTANGDFIILYAADGTDYAVFADKSAKELSTFTFPAVEDIASGDFLIISDTNGNKWAAAADLTGADTEPQMINWAGVPAARKCMVDLSEVTTDVEVAAAFEAAMDALVGFSDVIVTDDTAADGTMTFTQVSQGDPAAPVVKNKLETGAGSIAVTVTTAGSDVTPTAAAFLAVPSARRARANLISATTDVQVAAAFETAIDGITGLTAKITTDDSAADGTMLVTQVEVGETTAFVVSNAAGDGAGTIAVTEDTPGQASDLDIDANSVYVAAHGYESGLCVRLTTSDADLPAGLATGTDYFLIIVDSDHIKFASSLANSIAGTAINITDEGTGTHTIVQEALSGGDVQIQKCLDKDVSASSVWMDVTSKNQAITVDGNYAIEVSSAQYGWVRLKLAATKGRYILSSNLVGKGA